MYTCTCMMRTYTHKCACTPNTWLCLCCVVLFAGFAGPFVCLVVCLPACLVVCLFICLSVCLFVCPSVRLSVCLWGVFVWQCVPVCLSLCVCVCVRVYLSVCLLACRLPDHCLLSFFMPSTLLHYTVERRRRLLTIVTHVLSARRWRRHRRLCRFCSKRSTSSSAKDLSPV